MTREMKLYRRLRLSLDDQRARLAVWLLADIAEPNAAHLEMAVVGVRLLRPDTAGGYASVIKADLADYDFDRDMEALEFDRGDLDSNEAARTGWASYRQR